MSSTERPTGNASSAQQEAAPASLKIEGELTIYRAGELCIELRAALLQGGDLEIDLAEVSEMDSAGVQLLMAAKQAVRAGQRQMRLVGHSPAVLEVFETLNLAAHFGDPLVMAAQAARQPA